MFNGSLVEFFQLVVVEDELIAPCPAVVAVVVVDFLESAEHVLYVLQSAVEDIVGETLLFAFRQQQAGKVNPSAFSNFCLRHTEESLLDGTLQHGTHIDAEGDVVVFQAFPQR